MVWTWCRFVHDSYNWFTCNGLFLFVMSRANLRTNDPFLLVVHYNEEAEADVQAALPDNKLRSRTITSAGVELMVEVRMKAKNSANVNKLMKIKGVKDVALVS
jgi:hypothetical protein